MVENIREIIASNLQKYRKKAGLTQARLALSCKISISSVQRAEDPTYSEGMDINVILALAACLEVHPSKLFLGKNEKVQPTPEEALNVLRDALVAAKEASPPQPPQPDPTLAQEWLGILDDLNESEQKDLLALVRLKKKILLLGDQEETEETDEEEVVEDQKHKKPKRTGS